MGQYRLSLAVVVVAFGAAPALSDEPYFTGLGDLPGGAYWGFSTDISADGSTIVGYSRTANGDEAFRWTRAHGLEGLGVFPGDDESYAWGVLPDGSAVRGLSWPSRVNFIWTPRDGMIPDPIERWGLLNDVWTVGFGEIDDEFFRWRVGEPEPRSIGRLPGSHERVSARAICGDGSTVLADGYTDPYSTAYYWRPETGWQEVGDLPGGDINSLARGASANGRYIVGWSSSSEGQWGEAFRLDLVTAQMIGLGDVPGDRFDSDAIDVSADGSVVVGLSYAGEGPWTSRPTAFVWTDPERGGDGMRSLKRILEDDFGFDLTGWELNEVVGISDDGRTIAGYAFNPDFLVEPWVAHLGSPTLHVIGDCPGSMRFTVEYVSPDGRVAYLYASDEGRLEIPPGNPCSGTVLGLDGTVQLAEIVRARSNGVAVLEARVPPRACGRTFVQVIDLESCLTSNVGSL